MGKAAEHLKQILTHLEITNSMLAKAMKVDASLASRWLNGVRKLTLSSNITNALSL